MEFVSLFSLLFQALSLCFGLLSMFAPSSRFIRDEPERVESALKKCKKLTGTVFTLKR